jgi:hypothetical protein
MALENLSDDALQKIAEGRMEELSDAELQMVAGEDTSAMPEPDKLNKTADFIKRVGGVLSKPLEPIGKGIATIEQGSEDLSNKLAESGHPILGMHAAGPSLLLKGAQKPFEWMNQAGEAVAEKGAEYGMNPYVSAGLGTAIQMATEIAMGAEGIAKRAAIGSALEGGLKKAVEPVGKIAGKAKKFITEPTTSEVATSNAANLADLQAQKESARLAEREARLNKPQMLQEVRDTGAKDLREARKGLGQAKKGLIKSEQDAGVHFESTQAFEDFIKNPQEIQKFVESKYRLVKQGAQQLAQEGDSQTLQHLRKVSHEASRKAKLPVSQGGLELSPILKSQLDEIDKVAADALSIKEPKIGESLGKYRSAKDTITDLPSKIKEKLETRKAQIANEQIEKVKEISDIEQQIIKHRSEGSKAMTHAKEVEFKKKLIKAGLTGAGTWLGYRLLKN